MQPETKQLNVLEKLDKKIQENKTEPTPVQQWDQLAFAVIYKELEQAGVRKQFIKRCQQVSAQMIRGFRDKMTEQVKQSSVSAQEQIKYDEFKLANCWFFQLKKKRELRGYISFYKGKVAAYEDVKMGLQYQGIK